MRLDIGGENHGDKETEEGRRPRVDNLKQGKFYWVVRRNKESGAPESLA
jgi:hypothetical protein